MVVDTIGPTGGLLLMWDSRSFSLLNSWMDVFSISVLLEDLKNSSKWLLTSVYGPNNSQRRFEFWRELDMIRGRWNGPWCIGGDWYVIIYPSEKLGENKITSDMRRFSDWVDSHSLVDLQLTKASFTWSNYQRNPAMSILDRFLVNSEWVDSYPKVIQLAFSKTHVG